MILIQRQIDNKKGHAIGVHAPFLFIVPNSNLN